MQRNTILIIIAAVAVILISVGFLLRGSFQNKTIESSELLEENVIPTVDSSVKVLLESVKRGEVRLTVENAPKGTRGVEYELTYDAQNPGGEKGVIPQGAIGRCSKIDGNDWECRSTNQENIILGTCSSGTCVYHDIVGKIKVLLKLTGSYGQRIFEKEYDLELE